MSTTKTTNPSGTKSEYYVDAFRAELDAVWGHHTAFAKQLDELALSRALVTLVKKGHIYNCRSRRLLYHYLSEYKREKDTDYINVMYKQLPITKTGVSKYLSNVCTAYRSAPSRTFGPQGSQNDAWSPVYGLPQIDAAFRRAHRYARLLNCVAIRPVVRKGVLYIEVLTPDLFRVVTDPEDPRAAIEMWYPVADGDKIHLVRMTAETIEKRDVKDPKKIIGVAEPNGWGEMQWIFLRMEEGDGFYGDGGDIDMLEGLLEGRDQRLKGNTSVKFEGHSVMIGTNIGTDDDDDDAEVTIPPGAVIVANNVADDDALPDLKVVSGSGQFGSIDELRRKRLHELMRDRGLPDFALHENPGLPPSGAAMRAANRELEGIQEEDAPQLRVMEREFKRKLAIALNEAPIMVNGTKVGGALPVDDVVTVEYVREPIILEAKDELELDTKRYDADLIDLPTMVEKHGGMGKRPSEDEAVEYIRRNRLLRKRALTDVDLAEGEGAQSPAVAGNPLQESVGGSAQVASLQEKYGSGAMSREMAIANATIVFGFTEEEAKRLFPEIIEKATAPPPAEKPMGFQSEPIDARGTPLPLPNEDE